MCCSASVFSHDPPPALHGLAGVQGAEAMSLPYENATSGDKAFAEIQKILGRFGCDNYGIMHKAKEQITLVQFEHRGRVVQLPGHWGGYASA